MFLLMRALSQSLFVVCNCLHVKVLLLIVYTVCMSPVSTRGKKVTFGSNEMTSLTWVNLYTSDVDILLL